MTNESTKELFKQIAHCEEFEKAISDPDHPCHKIVTSQKEYFDRTEDYHIPEPWNGDIENAEILFISSNPSIDKDNKEEYPTTKDNIDFEYFDKRLLNAYKKPNWATYWTYVKKWASWILPEMPDKELLSKIALTEVVHCKSINEKLVVDNCKEKCSEKWLKRLLQIYKGTYIVIVGNKAKECFKGIDTNKTVIYTPSHNARKVNDKDRKQDIINQLKKQNY